MLAETFDSPDKLEMQDLKGKHLAHRISVL